MEWNIKDREAWDKRIQEKVQEFGLSCFPQEFEICDQHQMIGYMSYSGMPSHYHHWSYGKAYERQKTLYNYGVSGLPYEMVINSNPSVAYLMNKNTLCLQILTMAHVYAHNDFFKNNSTFKHTHPELTLSKFNNSALRIKKYIEDPSIGADKVEEFLDAAHALSLQCNKNLDVKKLTRKEQKQKLIDLSTPPKNEYSHLELKKEWTSPDLNKNPLEPDQDILLFIRDNNKQLEDWQKDILTIVHEQTLYFIPQIETKIMNEGWATYWHHKIMSSLDLPHDLFIEFTIRHSQVVRPHADSINPYYLGFKMWEDIARRNDNPTETEIEKYGRSSKSTKDIMFAIREADRDSSFLRRFLNSDLMIELDMYEYEEEDENVVIKKTAKESCEEIKAELLKSVGTSSIPVLQVEDANYDNSNILYIKHVHDERNLHPEHAKKSLEYIHTLWGRPVVLETKKDDKKSFCLISKDGYEVSDSL